MHSIPNCLCIFQTVLFLFLWEMCSFRESTLFFLFPLRLTPFSANEFLRPRFLLLLFRSVQIADRFHTHSSRKKRTENVPDFSTFLRYTVYGGSFLYLSIPPTVITHDIHSLEGGRKEGPLKGGRRECGGGVGTIGFQ